ncbi:ribosylnicotinamide kinase [Monascus purpureus]|uniref:Ribosylnicotinamide kinase n=1 Tax=Monascus purpureus TaxID=5098 RepID=A0A507QQQ2_MONPU|nr:ribosylnicotinamide kinase [Monascus purpureus]BDD58247.1 hypothetical protein MAP00_003538 [Monascus purpureus]
MPESEPQATDDQADNTLIIGISGPSSSGKTTLARLLQSIFSGLDVNTDSTDSTDSLSSSQNNNYDTDSKKLQTFIIHEDDFYVPDNRIPYTKTSSGKIVQDWDTINAIDIPFLSSSLSYVRKHGSLPPRLKSKEDLNEATDSGVDKDEIVRLRGLVRERLRLLQAEAEAQLQQQRQGQELTSSELNTTTKTLAFLEGFLLYSPPDEHNNNSNNHVLHPIHRNIHLHLFLPASYDSVKKRREGRSGYVTVGPAPEPEPGSVSISTNMPQRNSVSEELSKEETGNEVDLEKEDDSPPQNFWTDPPGYVDDIVWPHYVRDHSWLLLPEEGEGQDLNVDTMDDNELVKSVGQGTNVRTDAGVTVAPGGGGLPMVDIVKWAVEEVMKYWETREKRWRAV